MTAQSVTGVSGPGSAYEFPGRTFQALLKVLSSSNDNLVFSQDGDKLYLNPNAMGGNAGSMTSVIWRPFSPTGGNAYQSWDEVVDALQQIDGPKEIFVDMPQGTTVQMPVGNWVLDAGNTGGGVTIKGKFTELATPPIIQILDGTTIQGLAGFEYLTIENLSNNPVITYPSGVLSVFRIGLAGILESNGAAPLIEVLTGGQLVIFTEVGGKLNTGLTESVNLQTGTFAQFIAQTSSSINNNTISGAVGSTLRQRSQNPSAFTDTSSQFPTHVNFLGTLQNFIDSSSLQIDYTENNAPTLQNFSGVVPVSNQEAIDEIKTGRARKRINIVNGPIILDESYEVILVDASAGTFDVTLPLIADSSEPNYGKHFLIARLDTTANIVNVLAQGADQYQLLGNAPAASAGLPLGTFLDLYAESTTNVWLDIN